MKSKRFGAKAFFRETGYTDVDGKAVRVGLLIAILPIPDGHSLESEAQYEVEGMMREGNEIEMIVNHPSSIRERARGATPNNLLQMPIWKVAV